MTVWDELKARGLIAQVTDEEEIKEMVNNGKATFYIGFDPTADSLHVGHFMALCLMKRLQMAGNKPIALLGFFAETGNCIVKTAGRYPMLITPCSYPTPQKSLPDTGSSWKSQHS